MVGDSGSAHVGILQNFTNRILYGEELLGKEITLPVDEDLFYQLLQEHIQASQKQGVSFRSKIEDISGTYNPRWQGKQ